MRVATRNASRTCQCKTRWQIKVTPVPSNKPGIQHSTLANSLASFRNWSDEWGAMKNNTPHNAEATPGFAIQLLPETDLGTAMLIARRRRRTLRTDCRRHDHE
jgi:hypothetical protein